MKVAVLLATYNSEKYLADLLDSLVDQTYRNWELTVKDDGSSDSTLSILADYQKRDHRINVLKSDEINLGPAITFMKLLSYVEADYYFFCDHDDVWLADKVQKTLVVLQECEKENPDIPIVVHTDLKVVNKDLHVINPSFWKSSGIKPYLLKKKGISEVFNFVTGCTMCFNRKIKEIVFPFPHNIPMHDWWITLCVIKHKGRVVEIEEPLILYRQHSHNEVGARQVGLKYFFLKLLNCHTTFKKQFEHIKFLKEINGLGVAGYYYYKIYYTLIRKL
ncbi:glycosyltransferase family 2 protein [Chryseobacterium wangxinyae]|uniref:glycosyltransferase family 2 protein n=1 Tax=Chryseobacterium sp. CY350 TaxID=2997336 RepID=UPI00226F9912|nr:glycosyltransferase family 2 protein [Chryseobacterium sp. CY350]MCY0977110.1 glycosyltransferase family 2 protein [Chryseobacterium sp. CY350]WBZ97107.1 glycosyltransferase family 2 protein [Chryseobacterium sp. CY350]